MRKKKGERGQGTEVKVDSSSIEKQESTTVKQTVPRTSSRSDEESLSKQAAGGNNSVNVSRVNRKRVPLDTA